MIPTLKPNTPFKCLNVATNLWNGKLKLTTTVTSKFEAVDSVETMVREQVEGTNEITVLCCPEVVAVKLEEYYSCRSITCRKKKTLDDKDILFIKCTSCNRKQLTKSLKHTFIVEVIFEKRGQQTNLTIFPNVLDDLNLDKTIIEDEILMFEKYDFHYSRRRIVTKIVKHEEDLA